MFEIQRLTDSGFLPFFMLKMNMASMVTGVVKAFSMDEWLQKDTGNDLSSKSYLARRVLVFAEQLAWECLFMRICKCKLSHPETSGGLHTITPDQGEKVARSNM
jgi:hypothetical protein